MLLRSHFFSLLSFISEICGQALGMPSMELWSVKQHQEPLWFAVTLAHATFLKWVSSEICRKLQLVSRKGEGLSSC